MILMGKMWISGFSPRVCPTELRNLVSSLEYLVSNGRQVLLGGIRLGRSTTLSQRGNTSRLDDLATAEGWVGSSRMPHASYANTVTNDGPRFHPDIFDKHSLNPSLMPLR